MALEVHKRADSVLMLPHRLVTSEADARLIRTESFQSSASSSTSRRLNYRRLQN